MPDKLSAYHAKRNFNLTREPKGHVQPGQGDLQFVVQRHDASKLHYDFRLELGGVLKSWAIPKEPSLNPANKRLAVQVEDHPLDYARFEGIIPEHQYGAGVVEIWDSGYWEPKGDPAQGYRDGKLKFQLYGDRLQGGWMLLRTRMQGGSKKQWLLIKERDEAAASGKQQESEAPQKTKPQQRSSQESSLSARSSPVQAKHAATVAKAALPKHAAGTARPGNAALSKLPGAAKANLPATASAQLATLVDSAPAQGEWVYEVKYDGYRILARIENGQVRLVTRDGKDWTGKLPKLAKALQVLELDTAWLDGEIVVLDENGIPSFQQLQNAFDEKSTAQIIFFVFDLLYLNGYDLRNAPLHARRDQLATVLAKTNQEVIRYSAPLNEPANKLLESACQLSMEGIIGKLRNSLYTGKRSVDWIKLKCRKRQEFVIAGFTDPQGKRQFFGSLLLGVYTDDGQLQYAGRVGTGFDNTVLKSVHQQLKSLKQRRCPFPVQPKGPGIAKAHWLKPELVGEISFAEWTKDGLLRQAVFHGLRTDKPAQQIRREDAMPVQVKPLSKRSAVARQAEEQQSSKRQPSRPAAANASPIFHGIGISHADRVIDPSTGLTKLDLAQYYDTVASHLLPYLKNRPVYLLRSPGGLTGKAFFQRHAIRTPIPGIEVLDPSVDPEHQPLMVINSAHALLSAAQMGTFELHSCNATADLIERPDCMVFDLDPDPLLPWKTIVEGAKLTRQLLKELGLDCFIKTSGSKGLHLMVPFARRHEWGEVTQFSKAVAQHLAETIPSHFSATMGEENRVGKIYIDYLRNQKMASTVVPFSLRARKSLPVSTPIDWEELDEISGSAMWTITTLPQRLAEQKQDPWAAFFKSRHTLTKRMRQTLGIEENE